MTTPSESPHPQLPEIDDVRCRASFQAGMELAGGRWTGAILLAGHRGARRFKEYRGLVPGISDRLLTLRLKELVEHGLMERTVVPTTPVQIIYTPTAVGVELITALGPLAEWGVRNADAIS